MYEVEVTVILYSEVSSNDKVQEKGNKGFYSTKDSMKINLVLTS